MPSARGCSRQTSAVLAALMKQPSTWKYGYELSKGTGLKSGTLYPILTRLSDQGFLDSRWEEALQPGRPPRHIYRLTATGLALAREQLKVAAESEFGLRPIVAGGR